MEMTCTLLAEFAGNCPLCCRGKQLQEVVTFSSCLEAAHWEAGRSHLLGDALPMAFLMKSLHGCTRAGQWVLLDPCTLRVECGRNKGTMPTKPHGLKGSRGKSSHSPEWGLYFFLHPDTLSTTKSQRLSSWQSVESDKAIKSRSGVQGLSVANCHSQVIRLLSFHAQSFIHTLNSVPQRNNSTHLCVCCMCVFVGTCLWRPETDVKCLPLLPAIMFWDRASLWTWRSPIRLSCVGGDLWVSACFKCLQAWVL